MAKSSYVPTWPSLSLPLSSRGPVFQNKDKSQSQTKSRIKTVKMRLVWTWQLTLISHQVCARPRVRRSSNPWRSDEWAGATSSRLRSFLTRENRQFAKLAGHMWSLEVTLRQVCGGCFSNQQSEWSDESSEFSLNASMHVTENGQGKNVGHKAHGFVFLNFQFENKVKHNPWASGWSTSHRFQVLISTSKGDFPTDPCAQPIPFSWKPTENEALVHQ